MNEKDAGRWERVDEGKLKDLPRLGKAWEGIHFLKPEKTSAVDAELLRQALERR